MATFNPDALLNLEKRTGVKDSDIDDFVSKVQIEPPLPSRPC